MLSRLHQRLRAEHGFTLVELLVVILIIGILAAIAIPSFTNQRKKAQDASAETVARNVMTQVDDCYLTANDYGPCIGSDVIQRSGANAGTGADQASIFILDPSTYAISVTSADGNGFFLARSPAVQATPIRICIPATGRLPDGACKPGGLYAGYGWGQW